MEYPRGKNQHFRHLSSLLFIEVKKLPKQPGTFETCMEKVSGESTARKWLAKFKNGDFDVDDASRSGKPSEFDEERLKSFLKENGRQTSRELAEKINCDHKTILNHLHSMEFTEKLGAWVPYELNEKAIPKK